MVAVLFVDDEPDILDGLRRQLFSLRDEFECSFAASGAEALERLAQQPVDIVVSDMRMSGMDGVALLTEVSERYPDTARLVLSGQSDRVAVLRSVRAAHQYMAKPCDPGVLRATLRRCVALRDRRVDPHLRRLVSRLPSLPSLPQLYLDLLQQLEDPDVALADIARVIRGDQGMTAKVLQLVNSAFFGLRRRVSSVEMAVSILGLETLRGLVLSAQVFCQFSRRDLRRFALDTAQEHCLRVGWLARVLAKTSGGDATTCDDAMTAGLLHDVGKLILAVGLPLEYASSTQAVVTGVLPRPAAEDQFLGGRHAEVGGYLLGLWGLPEGVCNGVAWHHEPWRAPDLELGPHVFVWLADAMDYYFEAEVEPAELWQTAEAYQFLAATGLGDRLTDWLRLGRETLHHEAAHEHEGPVR